jgi:hypothetical protein
MAHVLIGWEFGAGRGHVLRIARLAEALEQAGHDVSVALQRPDLLAAERWRRRVWQAPVSPRMLVSGARPAKGIPTTMGDILARLGMDDAAIVASQVRGWRRLLDAFRPDLVIGDFAPFLLLAVRGRLPSILIGSGFLTPPDHLPAFPDLIEHPPSADEATTLATVNSGLAEAGAPTIGALPQVYASEARIPATLAEFDPYGAHRREPLASPLQGSVGEAAGGEEVFVYMTEAIAADSPLWRGLAAAALPVRVHVPRMRPDLRDALAGHGFIVEAEPLPFAEIAARSRLILSHGGTGLLCAAAAAGIPQIVCHYDLEKLLSGVAVARHNVGGHVSLGAIEPAAFASSLRQLHGDEALAGRARALGAAIRGRDQPQFDDAVLSAVAALL